MTTNQRVRVVVVDDSDVARSAVEDAVGRSGEFELVASAASGEEALSLVPRAHADLVLLDIRMPGLDGHETSRLLRAGGSRARIVLVSALGRHELPVGIESCGANAILHKSEVSPGRLGTVWRQLRSPGDEHVAVADPA